MVSVYRIITSFVAAVAAVSAQTYTPVSQPSTEVARVVPAEPRPNLTAEQRGDIFMARKMYREAVEVYSSQKPESAVITNKLGIAFHQQLDLVRARKQYERALKLDPKYSEAMNNLGTVYYAQKKHGRAIRLYNRALKIQPDSASILSNLGTAQFARKKYKEALEAYQRALAIDPDVFERRNSHGVLLQERSVEERAKFHFYMAKTYAKAGVVERALLYIRKALEEGFKDRDKFRQDPEFAKLQTLPEFEQLMSLEPRVL